MSCPCFGNMGSPAIQAAAWKQPRPRIRGCQSRKSSNHPESHRREQDDMANCGAETRSTIARTGAAGRPGFQWNVLTTSRLLAGVTLLGDRESSGRATAYSVSRAGRHGANHCDLPINLRCRVLPSFCTPKVLFVCEQATPRQSAISQPVEATPTPCVVVGLVASFGELSPLVPPLPGTARASLLGHEDEYGFLRLVRRAPEIPGCKCHRPQRIPGVPLHPFGMNFRRIVESESFQLIPRRPAGGRTGPSTSM